MKKHDYLYLIWKNPNTRRNYIVGKLLKKETEYEFEYCHEYKDAIEAGWGKLDAFPEEKVYTSKDLFITFSSRLPDKKRRNIQDILNKYGLKEYDSYELLKRSGARLPIDTYEFIDPIFDEDKIIDRTFYIVGIRHLSECSGNDCSLRPQIEIGENLILKKEPENAYDANAVQVLTKNGEYLGYIPRYYSEGVSWRLTNNMSYECIVIEVNDNNCEDCVRVNLKMPKN